MDLNPRRWKDGDHGTIGGNFTWRVVRGRKGEGDLILQLYVNGQFRNVPMELGFMFADFFPENEEQVLYPDDGAKRVAGGGGDYYMSECQRARKHGWRSAADKLIRERAARCRRRLYPPT